MTQLFDSAEGLTSKPPSETPEPPRRRQRADIEAQGQMPRRPTACGPCRARRQIRHIDSPGSLFH